jgi:hypothetical protein
MTHTHQTLLSAPYEKHTTRDILVLADVCFEMFPMKELRKPHLILDELRSAFPEFDEPEIYRAIAMALSWRRLLRDAGRPLH